MTRKVNPRRVPASRADVEKAKKDALDTAVEMAWAIFFTVLRDKEGMENDHLRRIWEHTEKLSDEITEGRVSVRDLIRTLQEEAGIAIKHGGRRK